MHTFLSVIILLSWQCLSEMLLNQFNIAPDFIFFFIFHFFLNIVSLCHLQFSDCWLFVVVVVVVVVVG